MPALLVQLNHWVLLAALAVHAALGLSVWWIALIYLRRRRAALAEEARLLAAPLGDDENLPHVLVQIPAFNEGRLVARAVAAAGALDWPRDRLHVQVLDDSSDGSEAFAAAAVAALRERGIDAVLLHREEREGFKGGALAAGLLYSDCPFIAVLDADYVPPVNFLRLAMRPLLQDGGLAFVQARCDFFNREESPITRMQQRMLDAHYGVEQPARSWSGQFLPFNGTGGIWRRAAIDDAGGWQGDTLAEDLDLSYRVQLRGWRARFLVSLAVPGELPHTLKSWQTQQFRWTKGVAEAGRKLLPAVWRAPLPLVRKVQATLHLGSSAFGPAVAVAIAAGAIDIVDGTGLTPLAVAMIAWVIVEGLGGLLLLMLLGQRDIRGARLRDELRRAPGIMVLFHYAALSNLRGVLEAFLGRRTSFVRTPKRSARLEVETPGND